MADANCEAVLYSPYPDRHRPARDVIPPFPVLRHFASLFTSARCAGYYLGSYDDATSNEIYR
jgi:hypothetical protein